MSKLRPCDIDGRKMSDYYGQRRRRLHYLLDVLIDERGIDGAIEAIREWLELAIDNERFQRHFTPGKYTGPNSAERILSALEGYSANPNKSEDCASNLCFEVHSSAPRTLS